MKMRANKKINILKTLVGSVAHGLDTPESDKDFRGVFVVPTSELVQIGSKTAQTNWMEGNIDDTAWEVQKFLLMATKCNPTVLEVFLAPIEEANEWGHKLRALFPYVWNSEGVLNAFIGYGLAQRKKFLDKKDNRPNKYAVAYLRTLYQAWELFNAGTFTVRVGDLPIGDTLRRWKMGDYTTGEVIQTCVDWEAMVREAYEFNSKKKTDLQAVNKFLVELRKEYWE